MNSGCYSSDFEDEQGEPSISFDGEPDSSQFFFEYFCVLKYNPLVMFKIMV